MQPVFPHPRSYLCRRTAAPLKIDGDLTKPAWKRAPWTEDFVDIEGDRRPRPTWRTRAKMLWDDQFLYVGAELQEPHVWATLTQHDSVIFHDNDFEIFIDPDGDNHDYYELEINALNTTWDLHLPKPYRDGGSARNEWEIPGMKTAVKVQGTLNDPSDTDRGWSVEIALPWEPLREFARCASPPREGDVWRVNFSRVEWTVDIKDAYYVKVPNRPEHNWVWSPQHAIDMHRPELWGYLRFAGDVSAGARRFRDPDWEARCRLMEVYHAQRAFRDRTRRWAEGLDELGIGTPGIAMQTTSDGWEATLGALRVRHDSRIRRDGA